MPWKLAVFLATLLCATLFIGFNLENRCDVSWIFGTFRDVPIFVSLLFAFTAGVLASVPFKLRSRRDRAARFDRADPVDRAGRPQRSDTEASLRRGTKKNGPSGGTSTSSRGPKEGV